MIEDDNIDELVQRVLTCSEDEFTSEIIKTGDDIKKAIMFILRANAYQKKGCSERIIKMCMDTADFHLRSAYIKGVDATKDDEGYVHPKQELEEFRCNFWREFNDTFQEYLV